MKESILTFLMAMLPVIELRGALPFGVASGLSFPEAFILSVMGNLLPVPFILIFIRSLFGWLKTKSARIGKYIIKIENRASKKSDRIGKYEFFGIIMLVAIPLPGTGAWTGSLVAAMLDMRIKRAFPAILIGVLIAGIIVYFVTYGASLVV